MSKNPERASLSVGVVAAVAAAIIAAMVLGRFGWDPSIFASFGDDAAAITEYAENRVGGEVLTRPGQGHDGKYFFVLANDPLLVDPASHASVIDRPRYRAQRMLYPLVSGAIAGFQPGTILWTLLMVNVVAMGLGSVAVGRIASDLGGSVWWGLAFALNLGFVIEQNIDGAGVIAAASAFWGLHLLMRGRINPAIGLLVASVLSREAMLVVVAGAGLWLWGRNRIAAIKVVSWPTVAVLAWGGYLRLRLGVETSGTEIQEIGLPFRGLYLAFQGWMTEPTNLVTGIAVVLLLIVFARRALNSGELAGWATLGFVPLAFLFSRQVWAGYFDISRAVAPAITAFVLLAFAKNTKTRDEFAHP